MCLASALWCLAQTLDLNLGKILALSVKKRFKVTRSVYEGIVLLWQKRQLLLTFRVFSPSTSSTETSGVGILDLVLDIIFLVIFLFSAIEELYSF